MDKLTRLSTEQRANLVAYLDGELDEDEAQEIEQVLARSEVARHEVERLARSCDLLELLPRTAASGDFTRQTISRMRALEGPRVLQRSMEWQRAGRRIVIACVASLGLVGAALGGFYLAARAVPNEADELLGNLPIVQHLEQYRETRDIEFLRELQRRGTFAAGADHE